MKHHLTVETDDRRWADTSCRKPDKLRTDGSLHPVTQHI